MSSFNEINTRFPIRNTPEQKQAFRDYVLGLEGLNAKVETLEKHDNVVIGDQEKAKVIFTAHYDTPRNMLIPNLMLPANKPLYYLYQMCVIVPLLAISVGAGLFVMSRGDSLLWQEAGLLTYLVIYFGLFFLIMKRGINKTNFNDNTSGASAVIDLALKIPEGLRDKVAFVLFDDEEKGLKGSKAMAKAHPAIKANTLVINLDCVGNGENFVCVYNKALAGDPVLEEIRKLLPDARLVCISRGSCNSDQKSFSRGIGVCACRKNRFGTLYTPYIHTKKDTVVNPANMDKLVNAFINADKLI